MRVSHSRLAEPVHRPGRAAVHYLRRRRVVAVGLGTAIARPLAAQGPWPQRPLRMVIGFPPGGGIDIIARLLATNLSASLGQPVVVENRTGANGNLALDSVARAAGDGYTLFFGNTGNLAINNELFPSLGFDTLRDFVPVGYVAENYFYFVVAQHLPVTTLAEFIAYARANPGRLNFGSAGIGSAHHLTFEMFRRAFGLDIVHVPYRGTAPAMQDFLSGNLDFFMDGYGGIEPILEARRGRLLATTAPDRLHWLPNVPTVAEAAPLPGFEVTAWMALMAPAATPDPVLRRLAREVEGALRDGGAMAATLASRGVLPRYRDTVTTRAIIAAERERWGRLIREAGITPRD